MSGRLIAVAVKDTKSCLPVLSWTASEVRPEHDEVHIVHVYRLLSFTECAWAPAVAANDERRAAARTVVSCAVSALRQQMSSLTVNGSAVVGDARAVIRDLSEIVDLVVVGRPGPGTFGDGLGRLAAGARCPVVSVPAGVWTTGADEPVVLLCETGRRSADALRFAFEAAAHRRSELVVAPVNADGERIDQAALPWRREYPGVSVAVRLPGDAIPCDAHRVPFIVTGRRILADIRHLPLRGAVAIVPEPPASDDRLVATALPGLPTADLTAHALRVSR